MAHKVQPSLLLVNDSLPKPVTMLTFSSSDIFYCMAPKNEEVWVGKRQTFVRSLYNAASQSTMCGLVMTAMCAIASYEKQMLILKIYEKVMSQDTF